MFGETPCSRYCERSNFEVPSDEGERNGPGARGGPSRDRSQKPPALRDDAFGPNLGHSGYSSNINRITPDRHLFGHERVKIESNRSSTAAFEPDDLGHRDDRLGRAVPTEIRKPRPVQALRRRCCSIRTREVSHSELDPTVGKLPPFLDNCHVPDLLTWLTEDFTSFAAGRVDRQREYFWLPRAMHPVCQIAGANEHVGPPSGMVPRIMIRCVKLKRGRRCGESYPC